MKDFYQLFESGIQEMYASENEIVDALPDLIKAAHEPKLKEALRHHLEETKNQVSRLEEISEELKIDLKKTAPCDVMHSLLQKGSKCAKLSCPNEVKDAAIIAAAQCVEHYEMAVYGTLKEFACMLKFNSAEKSLNETLQEEGNADKKLTEVAKGSLFAKGINKKACDETCS